VQLRDYLRVIRTRKWVIIVATVVTVVAALAVSLVQPHVYEAESSLLISESGSSATAMIDAALSGFSTQPERALQTQVRMFRMRPAFERTVRRLDLRMHPDELAEKVEITPEGQTNVITVTVRDGDPKRAALIADALAEEYALWVRDFSRSRIRAAATQVEEQLAEVRDELVELGVEAGRSPSERDRVALQITGQDYAGLSEQLRQLRIREEMEVGPVQVVNSAVVPEAPVSPTPARNAALALMLGAVLGLSGAFVLEALDTTVKTSEEAGELTGAPVLGIVPHRKDDEEAGIVLNQNVSTPVAEAFRSVRNSLDFINFEHRIKTLLVTSAAPSEGKSTVAANLAVGLARAGHRVVLVSVDFHRPKSAIYLGASEALGLSHVLTDQYALDVVMQDVGNDGLRVLAAGKVPPNPSELLGSSRMGALIEQLEAQADWVILDAPPVLAVADTTAVAKWADGTIMVVRAGKTTREAVERSVEMLGSVGARVIGAILFGVTGSGPGTVSYAYSSYASRRRGAA
jgi:capsular exopolysaccharide synthesis family protein